MNLNKKIGYLLDSGLTPKFISSINESTIDILYNRLVETKKKETKETESGKESPTAKAFQEKDNSLKVAIAKTDTAVTNPTITKSQIPQPTSSNVQQMNTQNREVTEKFKSKRKETKEQTTGVTTKITTEKVTSIDQSVLNTPQGVNVDGLNLQNQGGKLVARQIKETELTEKFESKAQQGLFWAKCNKCKTDDCKWCKMAKEFSKSTSKKQYEKMPEKKHPEKTVKYKKKNTNEEFTFKNYFDKVASVYTNTMKGKLTKEEIIKKQIDKIVETNLEPTMKKRELLRLIESQTKQKRSLNEDFYFDGEMEEAVEELDMFDYDEEKPFTEKPRGKFKMNGPAIIPIRIDPDRKREREREIDPDEWQPDEEEPENPEEGEETKIQGRKRNMNGPAIIPIRIDPDRKREREREIDPDEWQPDEEEPENPEEGEETKIQGRRNMKFMSEIKNKFNRTMNRLNETHYKPIKYKKY